MILLWFAFILVSLNHWKQQNKQQENPPFVVICFHFSIFEPLETTPGCVEVTEHLLWFAFILVSLNHWKQPELKRKGLGTVVICFHFSIFEPLETTQWQRIWILKKLWFAFILVSLNHWKQLLNRVYEVEGVVICFHFSIFEPLETTWTVSVIKIWWLWFAFILVSLNHWKQLLLL